MDFTIPKYYTTGVLNGDDLHFFYYDISLDYFQGWGDFYNWDLVVAEFKDKIDVDSCKPDEIPNDICPNTIRFTVSSRKDKDNGSKASAFFRHLRNSFAHFNISRLGENYILIDIDPRSGVVMSGNVNAELLKKMCFRFFDFRESNQ